MVDSTDSVGAGIDVDRPIMPDGYGVPVSADGLRSWSGVEQQLIEAMHVWLATTRPDGRPHVVPRWGVWLDRRFWYDGSPDTVHARNLRTNPACSLNLESGADVVIVEGTSKPSVPIFGELGERLSEAFGQKYGGRGYSPAPDAWSGPEAGGMLVFTPHKAMAWRDFPLDVTRFHFPDK
ncbi:MAG: pyridoxamine 5'-phosphate oxidase family protein [Acidimicrobiia bacterium]|nr:pyridoxamine 5'-phosphate oxidase family protein [Acidimicrobiia bacterium]